MELLRHAYTNRTGRDGAVVVKSYRGPDAARRRSREETVLRALNGLLPVPALIGADEGALSMEFLDGEHGQDLLRGGWAAQVLQACGHTLRRIHAIDVTTVFGGEPTPPGTVLVHGDYGPNNILLDPDTLAVTAVLDWEWAHPGDPSEDLAWCEWIIRSYHVQHLDALEGFFTAYGNPPPAWPIRHRQMVAQARALVDFTERWDQADVDRVQSRRRQLAATEAWTE